MSLGSTELVSATLMLVLSGFALGVSILAIVAVLFVRPTMEIGAGQAGGALGRITLEVPDQGVGRVSFVNRGSRVTLPARSLDGRSLPKDTNVLLVEIEDGVALVEAGSVEV